jgi:hypothetical protein
MSDTEDDDIFSTTSEAEVCEGDGSICAICQDEECSHTKMRLSCNHVFHAHCLATWFRENSACPLCRDDPVMSPVCVKERAKLVRRFSKSSRAPKDLKRLVKNLQDKEFSRKERKRAYISFKKKHSNILKELNRLRTSMGFAYGSVDNALLKLGVYHCDDMPVPPLRGY